MKYRRHAIGLKLFLALIPLLLLGGGISGNGAAQAGAPISANPPQTLDDSLVIRVYFRDTAERDRLATELGAEEVATTGGFLTVWTDRATYNDLIARGLRVEIDEKATKEANTPIVWGNTFYGGYRTVEEMQTFLDQKVAAYPTLAEKLDIGDSWCKTHPGQCTQPNSWNGFDLFVMHITNRSIPGPKPVFWFDAGIHSREIATPEVAMNYIAWLLDNYNTNADARWVVDHHDIWVMPMLNPDGHHMNESNGEGTPTSHRKNADRDDGCPNYDLFGTDINRNFNFKWGCCGGSSGNPCDQTYRGPAADSEEETVAVINRVRQLIPDQRGPGDLDMAPITTTGILVNMHSNAALNIHPWGWTTTFAPNYNEMNNIGRRMGASISYGGNGYESCQSHECLYFVDGDEKNWAYGELGIPAYSVEVHGSGFFPTFAYTRDNIWPSNRGAMLYASKVSRSPYLQTRGPDANTETVEPVTVNLGDTAQITATIKYDWPAPSYNQPNRYLQNVAAAEFYVDTPPWNGGTPIAMTAVDGTFDQPTEAVVGSLPTGSLTPGRHVIFVRGRGVNDYEGYQSWGPIGGVFVDVVAGGNTPTVTSTPVPPTLTMTAVPPTLTATVVLPTPTSTQVPPTGTISPSATGVATGTASNTPTNTPIVTGTPPSPTTTTCTTTFTDVPTTDPFYASIRCLSCMGIVSGYADGTFRPNNPVTRGQLAKMVSNSAGFNEPVSSQTFQDVPTNHTFYEWIERLVSRGYMTGYPCTSGSTVEPCVQPNNRPYFRPGANATRGQTAKIVANAAGFVEPVSGQTFQDVPTNHTFYEFIQRLANRNVMSGYQCGGAGEPCVGDRPYFRPGNDVTRGQSAKIVANSFFPGCNPAARP